MARKPTKHDLAADPEVGNSQGRDEFPVTDLPPANPLGEPVDDVEAYPNTSEAGKQAAALGLKTEESDGTFPAGETIVEHPLSPTDTNPNPHGQRSQLEITNTVVDSDTKVSKRVPMEDGDTEVEGLSDEPVHLGDGRTLAKGDRTKVSKDIANTDALKGKIKRV